MKKVRRQLAKIASLLCSFFGISAIVSCDVSTETVIDYPAMYGMPPSRSITGTVRGDSDGTGEKPLANVNVTIQKAATSGSSVEKIATCQTQEEGNYGITVHETGEYIFTFEDGDGAQNGLFKSQTKTITIDTLDDSTQTEDISLEIDNAE